MLTARQLEARQRGIGGSDVPALLGLPSPGGRTMKDVWLRKRRGRKLELEPYVVEEEDTEDKPSAFAPYVRGQPKDAGSILEGALAELYELLTGLDVARCRTLVGERAWYLANLDRVAGLALASRARVQTPRPNWAAMGVDRGVEIKLVGHWAAAELWPPDGVADHVAAQCQWYMGVTDLPRWDVMALVAGSQPRVVRLERDERLISAMKELADDFWERYVLADQPPPGWDPESSMRVLRAMSPDAVGEEIEDKSTEATSLMAELVKARARRKGADEEAKAITVALAYMCGDHPGITGTYGRFAFKRRPGNIDWAAIANELNGGPVFEQDLLERHRRKTERVAQGYPGKRWAADVLARVAEREQLTEAEPQNGAEGS